MELAREVVCAGFEGTSPGDAPLAELRALGIGGTILFARNVADREALVALVAALRATLADEAGVAPLIAIDQEGGQVARIREGVVELPAMMALGATRDPLLAQRAGTSLGADLARIGINVDLAPVVDLALEARNTVIGSRAFGEDPELVAAMGIAFAQGLEAGGVIPVVKHFPGHGATEIDSHLELPVLNVDEATWRSRDLVPFARAMTAGVPAMMSAHVILPAFDAERPATISPAILTGVVREELHYDGVIFSDCLEMAAIAGAPTDRTAALALAAGVDCVLISHRLDLARAAIAGIERAVSTGELPHTRLEEAAARVRRLRARAAAMRPALGGETEIGLEIARRAVTMIRGTFALAEGEPCTVISFEETERPSLSAALRRRRVKSEIMRVALEPRDDELALLEMVLRSLPGRAVVIVTRCAHLYERQAQAVARILAVAPEAAIVSANEPYDVSLFPQARTVACIYDDGAISLEGLADVVTGRAAAAGTLPVRIDPAAAR